MSTNIASMIVLLLSFVMTFSGQQWQLKPTPIQPTPWASGQVMYQEYCAACHGNHGDGRGPAARAMKGPVPDLTAMAQRNGGKFPYNRFELILRVGAEGTVHPSGQYAGQMPAWQPLFATLPGETEAISYQRISNLARYVESLQNKADPTQASTPVRESRARD
jgi:mono/diheme cytochrome c family protein